MENKYVVSIIHGSKEHIKRYEGLIKELNNNGIEVVAHDLATHGENYKGENHNFSLEEMLDSALAIVDEAKDKYPDHKQIIFGHSMGSFIVKYIVYTNKRTFDGVILSGTNNPDMFVNEISLFLNGIGDADKVHKFNEELSYGALSLNSFIHGHGGGWLSTDEGNAQRFEEDPLCGNDFTNKSLKAMFTFIKESQSKEVLEEFKNKEIPQLLIYGKKDPVGNFGTDIKRLVKHQNKFGINNHKVIEYPNSKHEVLFDVDGQQATKDIIEFIKTI